METDSIIYKSVLTCPHCGNKKEEDMHDNSCKYLYTCKNCGTVLKPKEGQCCVYCSYGTVKCPSMQKVEQEVCGDFCC